MPEVWIPGVEGPYGAFVDAVHRLIARFAADAGVERAFVELELEDGGRFVLDSLSPEPGYGFVTIRPHPTDEDDVPEALVVPLNAIRRVELRRAEEQRAAFGFTLPK